MSLPEGVLVRVEGVGVCGGERSSMHVQSVSHWAPANIGPYSQAYTVSLYSQAYTVSPYSQAYTVSLYSQAYTFVIMARGGWKLLISGTHIAAIIPA